MNELWISRRGQAGFRNRGCRLGCREETNQRPRRLGLLGVAGNDAGEREPGLQFGRQRSNKVDTGYVHEFADLLETDLRLAPCHHCGYWFARRRTANLAA